MEILGAGLRSDSERSSSIAWCGIDGEKKVRTFFRVCLWTTQREILRFNAFTTATNPPKSSGEGGCSREGLDATYSCCCGDHVVLFTAHQHWSLITINFFYVYGSAFSCRDICFLFVFFIFEMSSIPSTPLWWILRRFPSCQPHQSFCWLYTRGTDRETLQKLSRPSLGQLCSHMQSPKKSCGSPEFSACLKAAKDKSGFINL